MARLFVSAAHKSSGKTTVTIGLAAAFRARGLDPAVFKKGPDYIDPLWLARASGRAVYNLDFNTQTGGEIRSLFAEKAAGAGVALIEGNKGLHDGVDTAGSDSSAALARALAAPVVLVVDVTGMTRGIAPLLLGYKAFDPEVRIGGVILNQVATARQEQKLRAAVAAYTDIPVLGALPRAPAVIVKERHLGLTTPGDADGPDARIEAIRTVVEVGVDVDAVLALARTALPFQAPARPLAPARNADIVIGVARDEAFCFYYADDLEALERAGARLSFFSPLRDARLPAVDGLFVGGGFPETHGPALAANAGLRADIAAAVAAGMPVRAECGGLMYMARSIAFGGRSDAMVGAVPADAVMMDRPQGRGLALLAPAGASPGETIPAHEFHHARLVGLSDDARFAWRVLRGDGIDGRHDGVMVDNLVAGFCHLRDTSRFRWADAFVDQVRRRKNQTGSRRVNN